MLRYMLHGNAQMTRLTQLCIRYIQVEGKRVLIFIDTPLIQQLVAATLSYAGFDVRTIQAIDPTKDRAKNMKDFNDRDSGVEAVRLPTFRISVSWASCSTSTPRRKACC